MSTRRLSMLLIGAWIGISLALLAVSVLNTRNLHLVVESKTPQVAAAVKQLTPEKAQAVLQHHAAEMTRHLTDLYGYAQIGLAVALGTVLLFATNGRSWMMALAGALLVITLVERFFLFPEMDYLGRMLDFERPDGNVAARQRLSSFQMAFGVVEGGKWLLMTVLGARLLLGGTERRRRHHHSEDLETEETRIPTRP